MVSRHFRAQARRIALRGALFAAVFGGGGVMTQKFLKHAEQGDVVSFTELKQLSGDKTISDVRIEGGTAIGEGVDAIGHRHKYHTPMPDKYDPDAMVNNFFPARVTFESKNWWEESGPLWIAAVGGLAVAVIALSDSRKNALERNVFRLMRFTPEKNDAVFADLAGMESIMPDARKIARSVKGEKPHRDHGSKPPKGVLIVGDEGSGKNLLARAIAHEAGASLFSVAASSLKSLFHGNPAMQIDALVKAARENAPSLVLIRGIDDIARDKTAPGGHSDEDENVLMELFKQMDACLNEPVQFVFTTDKPETLDPRFDRSGRSDEKIYMPRPDLKGRTEILDHYARDKALADDVNLAAIAYDAFDFSPADLERAVNEAARLAEDEPDAAEITNAHFDRAVEIIRQDGRKPPHMTEEQKRTAAIHKAGHAMVAALLEKDGCPAPGRLTLAAHERVSSIEEIHQQENGAFYTKQEFETALAFLFGGRAAEELIAGNGKGISTAGSEDIAKATQFAVDMVTRFGFSSLGPVLIGGQPDTRGHEFEASMKAKVDDEIQTILTNAYKKAQAMLGDRKDALRRMTEKLLEKESLSADEIRALACPPAAPTARLAAAAPAP